MDWGQIKTNLANTGIIAILAFAIGVLFTSAQTRGTANELSELRRSIAEHDKRLDRNDAHNNSEREFSNCVQLALQSLRQGAKNEQVCQLKAD